MAKATGMSPTTVGRIWRAFELNPRLSENFKLSTDPLFIERVRDIVGRYLDPPERAMVLALTRSPRSRPSTAPSPSFRSCPASPPAGATTTQRHAITSLSAALDYATGNVISSLEAVTAP